jgi:hypothetical protein
LVGNLPGRCQIRPPKALTLKLRGGKKPLPRKEWDTLETPEPDSTSKGPEELVEELARATAPSQPVER